MRQLTYVLDEHLSMEQMWENVRVHPDFVSAATRLQIVFEPNDDHEALEARLAHNRDALPDTIVVGMTTLGPVNERTQYARHAICTFLLFEQGEAHVDTYDCHTMSVAEAARDYCDRLDTYNHAKAVMLISSYAQLCPDAFIEAVAETHPHVPLFGAQAGTSDLTSDRSAFFTNDAVCDRGVMAVTLCGKDLHVTCSYNLGWHPVGKELTVTGYDLGGLVTTIDDCPAVNIYNRYLNVQPDEYFFDNTCSFPLLGTSGKRIVARTPLGYTADGALQFGMPVPAGTRLRLSYTKPEYLLGESVSSSNALASFRPQALLLFACLNRREFLGAELAEREFWYYRNACPSMTWVYGYGEILRTSEGGGILNSSIVSVGLREGEAAGPTPDPIRDPSLETPAAVVPLSERLAAFLEATTVELNELVEEQSRLAERDQLTGLYNRRRMDELLRYELSKHRIENDLSLLVLDIDHFKKVNDTYGHDVGDSVLRELSSCVQTMTQAGDTLARWGGEEFVCLLPDTDAKEAAAVAERMRARVANVSFAYAGHVTISVGVSAARPDDTPESLFRRADKALYHAKKDGRYQVVVGR